MPDQATNPGHVVSFDVEYQASFGGTSNKELKGRGQLTINPTGPVYEFSGLRRRLFSSEQITVTFGPADVANVTVDGRGVRFIARPSTPTGDARPFEFYCRDGDEARTVAALLPRHQLQGFAESRDFMARLEGLSGAGSSRLSVTNVIIALNVIAFVILAGVLGAGVVTVSDIKPYILYGANNGAATTDGGWWRLLTSMFMHYGILHAGLNMWALSNVGGFLEKLQGRTLFAITYLGCGLAGGFASILWNGDKVWSAGASGAVFGVIGGIIGFMLREKQGIPKSILQGMMRSSLSFAAYNIIIGFAIKGIDNAAHLGGLAAGIVLGWLLAIPVESEARRRLTGGRAVLGIAALALLTGAGINYTPRFDYRVADELAWNDSVEDFGPREEQLVKEHNRALATLQQEGDAGALAAWVDKIPAPFYREWRGRLAALDLAPGLRTDTRRQRLIEIFDLKLRAYDDLSRALRAGSPNALEQYARDEARIAQMIRSLAGG